MVYLLLYLRFQHRCKCKKIQRQRRPLNSEHQFLDQRHIPFADIYFVVTVQDQQ